jgi:O-antigen/teichoic acid export membrane protein
VSTTAASDVSAVARGGAANMLGAVVYGASNFVLLIVLNRVLGVDDAGVVVVAIALFNVISTIAGLGCSTGLVRMLSHDRATGEAWRLPATVRVALVPVAIVSVATAVVVAVAAPALASLLAEGDQVDPVASVLRWMSLFLPAAAIHTVVIQGTRGFGTMKPLVAIERIGRAVALPVVVGVVAAAGAGPVASGSAWAATNLVALHFSWRALKRRVDAAVAETGVEPVPADSEIRRRYWAFTAPRAVGQASEVAVNWLDTIVVSAIVSTTAAGVYASGSRYLLPGLFAAEALMQVTGPRISGLLATDRKREASALLKVVAGWQVSVMWPLYALIALFPTPLLQVFGEQVVDAKGALVWLALAMMVSSPIGPAPSAILMSGRSTQAMFNTLVVLAVNLVGNLVFVPDHGITAAGAVWGATIVVAAVLPGWQCRHLLGVSTIGRPALVAAALTTATVGAAGIVARLWFGDAISGLIAAGSVGGAAYVVGLAACRNQLHLDALRAGVTRRPAPTNHSQTVSTDEQAGDERT